MIRQPSDFQKYIYHFTTAKTALNRILPERRLKFSKFNRLNDPKENLSFGFWSILDTMDPEADPDLFREIKKQIRKRIRILCFTEDYRERYGSRIIVESGFKHPRMWDRYASGDRGICLVFHKQMLIGQLREQLGDENLLAGRIYYTPKLKFPRFSVEDYRKDAKRFVNEYIRKNARELFFMKHFDWRTEHEFRILFRGPQKEAGYGNSLFGVIMGINFSTRDSREFMEIVPEEVKTGKIDYREGNLVLRSLERHCSE